MFLDAGKTLEFGDPHRSALGPDRLLREHVMAEGLWNRLGAHELIRAERTGDRRFENVELARVGRMSEQRWRQAEILAQNLSGDMLEPVAEQKRVVLVEVAIIEDEEEFATVGTEALDRMGNAAGEIPEIADADVVDKVTALRVNRRDAGRSGEHVRPFRLLMPVKLANAARIQPHVHAGDCFRNTKLSGCDLTCPAAARLPHMRIGEGEPEIGQSSGIRCRRIEEVRILSFPGHVSRDRIRAADARRPARLWNLFAGASGGCAQERACAHSCAG